MKSPQDDRRLDEAIARTAPKPAPVPQFGQWQQTHPEAVAALKAGPKRTLRPFPFYSLLASRPVKVAALVALTLGLGFVMGRLSGGQRIDTQRLRTEMEASVLSAVNQQLQSTLKQHADQIKVEMAQQVRVDLARFATQTLAIQDQKINDLTQSIAAVRSMDRQRIVAALEQMEMTRLGDRAQLASGLQALALQGNQTVRRPSN
jgi:hypothetical protein